MQEYRGKYTDCKVFNDYIEETAVQQIYSFLNCPVFDGETIRIMPDVHAGSGAVIGFTSTFTDKVIPNVIGVDIGCGVLSVKFEAEDINFEALDKFIKRNIPHGFQANEVIRPEIKKPFLTKINNITKIIGEKHPDRDAKSIGSLGGGNHFIEIGKDTIDGSYWLTVHSGSRNFGLRIALYHQKIAKKLNPFGDLSWLEGDEAQLYIEHMRVAQEYATLNRELMVASIVKHLGIKGLDYVESVHNYIDFNQGIIRKGTISATEGQKVVIPWNMQDGLIIGRGKGNDDWNNSAPHGAGRILSRGKAKRSLCVDEFKERMEDIYTSCVNEGTLDESPMAYKNSEEIIKYIEPTIEILHTVKPVYNFKA